MFVNRHRFMKKFTALLTCFALILGGCSGGAGDNGFEQNKPSEGEIGGFSLTSPSDDAELNTLKPKFEWTSAENAESYTLTLALDDGFKDILLTKSNLSETSYTPASELPMKKSIYWRVKAQNAKQFKTSQVRTLTCKLSGEAAEVKIDLGTTEEYSVNAGGMPMTVEIAGAEGDKALTAVWQKNTVGWGAVYKQVYAPLYMGDAVKITFQYSGAGALAFRFVEQDNDMFYSQFGGTPGVENVAVIPVSDFTLRSDESFGNREYDGETMSQIQFLVENTYSAGTLAVRELKIVNYDDYREKPVSSLPAGIPADYAVNPGGYRFDLETDETSFGENEKGIKLVYGADVNSVGWGVVSKSYGALLAEGDAFRVRYVSTGTALGEIFVRLTEGDGDVWRAMLPVEDAGIVGEAILPFGELEYFAGESKGDGKLQMAKVLSVAFGIGGAYGAGTCSFGAVEVIDTADLPKPLDFAVDNVFGSNMVLQRGKENTLFGTGVSGDRLTVRFDGADISAAVNAEGVWSAALPAKTAGGEYEISVTDASNTVTLEHVTFGDVYLVSGQSNMLFQLSQTGDTVDANRENIRLYMQSENPQNAPARQTKNGRWSVSTDQSAGAFSAVGWYFAEALNAELDVPIGVLMAAVGGTNIEEWMSGQAYSGSFANKNRFYNGMVSPLSKLNVKGAVWYQGENNCGKPAQYETLLTDYLADLRGAFQSPDLPVAVVQLPIYSHAYNWAYLREIQQKVCDADENAYLAVTLDGGNPADIHPVQKDYVGERAALLMLRHAYGKPLLSDSAQFVSCEANGGEMLVSLTNSEGASVVGTDLSALEVDGSDGVFASVTSASFRDGKLVLTADSVPAPKYVRYAFSRTPKTCLKVGELPVAPFRSYTNELGIRQSLGSAAQYSSNPGGSPIAASVSNGTLTLQYVNSQGWGVVSRQSGEKFDGGKYLSLAFEKTGDAANLSLRIRDADGDLFKAPLSPLFDGRVYADLTSMTRDDGSSWGDGTLDVSNVMDYFEILFEAAYGSTTVKLSDLRIVEAKPEAPKTVTVIDDFEGYADDSALRTVWTGENSNETAVPLAALNSDNKSGGLRGVSLRYKNKGFDTTYSRAVSGVDSKSDTLAMWLKVDPGATVFVQLKAVETVSGQEKIFKVILTGAQLSAEGKTLRFALSDFQADGGGSFAADKITGFSIMFQNWGGDNYDQVYAYLDDLRIGLSQDL